MLLAAIAAMASGCVTERSVVVVQCPPLRVYSKEEGLKAYDEYKALPRDAMLRLYIDDYGEVRARCNAIAKREAP